MEILRFTIGYTENAKPVFVCVDTTWVSGNAIDVEGYSYKWEDGYLTNKSDKPIIKNHLTFIEAFEKIERQVNSLIK